jgi:predicted O-methyltransferase YrrM
VTDPKPEKFPTWYQHDYETEVPVLFPPGHFYSPLPDTRQLSTAEERERVWPETPRPTPGIDWREEAQVALCRSFSAQQEMVFPSQPTGSELEYSAATVGFPLLDAVVLQAMLQHLRPRRMIEVGAGYSSTVTARVNREVLDGQLHFTCIDPYPPPWLMPEVGGGITAMRVEEIQQTPLEVFSELEQNDILFIDTSHTVKTGGDVPWLFGEVIPRLKAGVVVHVHDAFLPGDYPAHWVLEEGRGWNEAYLLHAFLSFNAEFQVLFGVQYMAYHHAELLASTFKQVDHVAPYLGGSLWFQRVT